MLQNFFEALTYVEFPIIYAFIKTKDFVTGAHLIYN
jgi:hypothetical protein